MKKINAHTARTKVDNARKIAHIINEKAHNNVRNVNNAVKGTHKNVNNANKVLKLTKKQQVLTIAAVATSVPVIAVLTTTLALGLYSVLLEEDFYLGLLDE